MSPADGERQFLRHALATLAYRGAKALRGVGDSAAGFRAGPGTRTPLEILAHVGDLLDWGCALARGEPAWHDTKPVSWEAESARFFDGLRRFDQRLAAAEPLGCSVEKLFQGPVADALTHVGQIAMLRRLAGAAVKGENYFKADIAAGRVGPEQSSPRMEFD
jgi:hypothetical protein